MDRSTDGTRRLDPGCPHTRGDGPARGRVTMDEQFVVPTRVGMDRSGCPTRRRCWRCPHTRGDGPMERPRRFREIVLSPHAWGWTGRWAEATRCTLVVPTRVGMDRRPASAPSDATGCPHTRGDGPGCWAGHWRAPELSPHAWGWTVQSIECSNVIICCPHTRGDGPGRSRGADCLLRLSPHAWGWTVWGCGLVLSGKVVPTRVGMDRSLSLTSPVRLCCPHTRGDGPRMALALPGALTLSPHAWGWTAHWYHSVNARAVVPTRVGMDRMGNVRARANARCPHTRGDGPAGAEAGALEVELSPHAWGWTAKGKVAGGELLVVPTRVGMDRC